MNDKYIAERLAIIEMKIDCLATIQTHATNIIRCPFCEEKIKYTIATDGAPVRKCGCTTGIVPVDVNSYSNSQSNSK